LSYLLLNNGGKLALEIGGFLLLSLDTVIQPESTGGWSREDYKKYRRYDEYLERLKHGVKKKDIDELAQIARVIGPRLERDLTAASAAIEQDINNFEILQSAIFDSIEKLIAENKKRLQEQENRRMMENEIAMILLLA
jgi:hypothetical protein